MALQESYTELVEKARLFEENGMHSAAYDILRRVALRLSRLNPETLKKRQDLHTLFISALMDADVMGRRLGQTDEVVELGDAMGRALPEYAPLDQLIKAQALNDAGRLDEGMALLLGVTVTNEQMIAPIKAMAAEAIWFQRPADALTILAKIPEKNVPESDKDGRREAAEVSYLRFRALVALERMDEAAEAWLKAYHQSSQDRPPAREIVSAFIARGELDKALDFADRESLPATRGLLRGLVARLKGKLDWAKDEWWRVVREPFNVESGDFMDWIECALRSGDEEKLNKALEAGLEKFGFVTRLFMIEGILAAQDNDMESARRLFRTILMANDAAKWQRQDNIWDTDPMLVEHTVTPEQGREELIELLRHKPTPQELQEWALEMRKMGEEAAAAAEAESDADFDDEEDAGDPDDDEEEMGAGEAPAEEA